MSENDQTPSNRQPNNKLTDKQWKVVGAVGLATIPAGPIVVATAALGTAGGCYLSNALGWSGE